MHPFIYTYLMGGLLTEVVLLLTLINAPLRSFIGLRAYLIMHLAIWLLWPLMWLGLVLLFAL